MLNAIVDNTTAVTVSPASTGIRVLILDDSQFDRTKIRRMFRTSEMDVVLDEAESIAELQLALDQGEFDIVLVDYNLPQGDGIDAVKLVKEHSSNFGAATIMVTGDDQSQIAVDAMKMGCQDYMSKDRLSSESLQASILRAIQGSELIRTKANSRSSNIEKLAKLVMSNYSTALQPEIASIVREMRRLRGTMANPDSNLPGDLEAIERNCIRLWAILSKPEDLGLSTNALIRASAKLGEVNH